MGWGISEGKVTTGGVSSTTKTTVFVAYQGTPLTVGIPRRPYRQNSYWEVVFHTHITLNDSNFSDKGSNKDGDIPWNIEASGYHPGKNVVSVLFYPDGPGSWAASIWVQGLKPAGIGVDVGVLGWAADPSACQNVGGLP